MVGGGFGGFPVAKNLAIKEKEVEVVFTNKKSHHTFQPLLDQVATTVL